MCDGRRSLSSDDHEHLDSTSFWKQAYEESEAAQAKLLDKIYELEQRSTLEQEKHNLFDIPPDPESPCPKAIGKRKRATEPVAKANSQSKRKGLLGKAPKLSHTTLAQPLVDAIADQSNILEGRHSV